MYDTGLVDFEVNLTSLYLFDSAGNKIADVTGCEGLRGEDEEFYLDWGLQSAACFVAHQLGYKGVAVEDEHGVSYMLVPGEKFERID